MTEEEVTQLVREWAVEKGGVFTEDELDALAAVLSEHLPSPDEATLDEARQVLGLRQ